MNKKCLFALSIVFTLFFASQIRAEDSIPQHIDLSDTKYFPPIFNQGDIGSCDWFAVVYYQMTYIYNKVYNRSVDSGNTFSPKLGYNVLNNGGAYPFNIRVDDVYKFSLKHGSATMADFPYDMDYKPWCTDAEIWKKALTYRLENFTHFTCKYRDPTADYSFPDSTAWLSEIKKLLSRGEVLVIQSTTFSGSLFKAISDDTATHEDDKYVGEQILYSGNNGPDHTLALVGYNDHIWVDLNDDSIVQNNEKGALKIADSYGVNSYSHNKGFLWMAYSTVPSSIWQYRVNRMTVRSNYKPKIFCKLTLNSTKRDNLRFQFGRSASNNSIDIPVDNPFVFDPNGLGYGSGTNGVSLITGANCSFNGGFDASDGNFVFDLSDIYNDNNTNYWYLKIDNNSDTPCIIKKFEITNSENTVLAQDITLPDTLINKETYRFLKPLNSPATVPNHNGKITLNSIKTYPNPVSSELTLSNCLSLAGGTVKLFSQHGRLLSTSNILSKDIIRVQMNNAPPGSYMVVLIDKNGRIKQNVKIIKM